MSERNSFDYAVVRLVPRVDREEFINAGVIVFCLARNFLQARVAFDEQRIAALWPDAPQEQAKAHLEAIPRICSGGIAAGPLGALSARERFHWLVSPRSTVIQISPVHTGLCKTPEEALDHLFRSLVVVSR